MCFRGGGNRGEARDIVRGADLAAKQLGSGATHVALCNNIGLYFIHLCKVLAAKFLDAKMPRGIDAWPVSVELFSSFAAALYCNKLDSFAIRSE